MRTSIIGIPATIYYEEIESQLDGAASFFLWHNDTLLDVFMTKEQVNEAAYKFFTQGGTNNE